MNVESIVINYLVVFKYCFVCPGAGARFRPSWSFGGFGLAAGCRWFPDASNSAWPGAAGFQTRAFRLGRVPLHHKLLASGGSRSGQGTMTMMMTTTDDDSSDDDDVSQFENHATRTKSSHRHCRKSTQCQSECKTLVASSWTV